ncbi:MAG: class II aldolase/adducin family protein [Rhodospirillales bacterium]|nr:class II aldolase/adducin family protein [Rhodospirillales bacterium]
MTPIAADPEFRALLRYSAAIGADPALVQGAGGNVSLKRDGVLWVKASGTWLARAGAQDIMVPLALAPLQDAIRADDMAAMEACARFVRTGDNPSGLRPSIETTMHALLPHPVVVHVHCVETIAWACRADAEATLTPLLAGLAWRFVPYIRPGAPLTREIAARLRPGTDVLVLGNHGLVVGAATVAAAGQLVAEVARRLRRTPRPVPQAGALPQVAGYRPAGDALAHGTATDPRSLEVARRGSLYPDHVIFLGPGIAEAPAGNPAMLVVAGQGVLLREDASPGAVALARCLADVAARLDPAEPLRVFSAAEESELLGWDAEQYRKALAAGQ